MVFPSIEQASAPTGRHTYRLEASSTRALLIFWQAAAIGDKRAQQVWRSSIRHGNTPHSVSSSEFPSVRFALPRDHADASGFSDGLTPIQPLLLRVTGRGGAEVHI